MSDSPQVERIGEGVYRVTEAGASEIVYVAASPSGVWSFWKGRVYLTSHSTAPRASARHSTSHVMESLSAPMPATVIKVLVAPGTSVHKGDTVVVLEAMKMELPLRAAGDATVTAVHCREGELVQPDAVLVEFGSVP
jgi:3-methylcrotonyl-CoA carboxylase alpha subunit